MPTEAVQWITSCGHGLFLKHVCSGTFLTHKQAFLKNFLKRNGSACKRMTAAAYDPKSSLFYRGGADTFLYRTRLQLLQSPQASAVALPLPLSPPPSTRTTTTLPTPCPPPSYLTWRWSCCFPSWAGHWVWRIRPLASGQVRRWAAPRLPASSWWSAHWLPSDWIPPSPAWRRLASAPWFTVSSFLRWL